MILFLQPEMIFLGMVKELEILRSKAVKISKALLKLKKVSDNRI